jgi:2-keto-4-pentenoate hydratase
MSSDDVEHWADVLVRARRDRRTRPAITSTVPLSIRDAYAIQRRVTARRTDAGERVVGWKLGYTSQAMREQMGVDAPNFGPLTDAMLLRSGDAVGEALMQPRVEPEIALRFAHSVPPDADIAAVLAASESAHACLEVVDSVYTDYRFRLEDNTADGSSAAQVVIGPSLGTVRGLDEIDVVLAHNAVEVACGRGDAASGHPAAGIVWLAGQLASTGERIDAGQIVITGGLTAAVPLAPGDHVTAVFGGTISVTVRR